MILPEGSSQSRADPPNTLLVSSPLPDRGVVPMESQPLAGPTADSNNSKKRFNAAPIMDAEVAQVEPTTPWSSKFQKIDDEEVLSDEDNYVDSNEGFLDDDDDANTVMEEDKAMKGKAIIDDSDGNLNDLSVVVEEKLDISTVDDQDLYDDNNDDDDQDLYADNNDYDDYGYDDDYLGYFPEDDSVVYDKLQAQFDNMDDVPPGVEASFPWLGDSSKSKKSEEEEEEEEEEEDETSSEYAKLPTLKDKNGRVITAIDQENVRVVDIMCRYEHFRRFDTVDDFSDHHYAESKFKVIKPTKNWAKRIQEEWKILEKDLPETIFVRVYEERMDLLRAVILGAEGTPYHDGLFFFDVIFPRTYPDTPPLVYYQSHGLRLNPNLYDTGYVCLSLLNTWQGKAEQKWQPKVSTMLQVLVSIQGLVLNADPYFNEPGYESSRDTDQGKKRSNKYTENTFILSLQTMSYNMRKPPKHFEDFVHGHFLIHAENILEKCRGYLDGGRVGSLVKGEKQEGPGCSDGFKRSLEVYLKYLSKDFTEIGIKGVDKFLPASLKKKKQIGSSSLVK